MVGSCLALQGCGTPDARAAERQDRQQRRAEAAVVKRLEAHGVELPEAVHPSPAPRYADPSPVEAKKKETKEAVLKYQATLPK